MKVCFLTTSFPRNPDDEAGVFIAKLAEALSEHNVMGTVVAPGDSKASESDSYAGWQVLRPRYGIFLSSQLAYGAGIVPNIRRQPWLVLQIPSLLLTMALTAKSRSQNSDIFHAHWIASMLPAFVAALLSRKPVLVTVRGVDLKLLRVPVLGTMLKFLLGRCDAISTVSLHFQEKLQGLLPKCSIHLIENGVDRVEPDSRRQNLLLKFGLQLNKYLIFAGRLIPLKRIEMLLSLFVKVRSQDIKLVLCGSLDEQSYVTTLKEKIRKMNLGDRVLLLGSLSPSEYRQLLSGAVLYCSASEYEGRPNSVLEALAQGVPAVVSDIDAHTALIQDGINGLIFNSEGLEAAAEKVDDLIRDQDDWQNLSKGASQSLKSISWSDCALRYLELYSSILMSRQPAR